LAKPTEIVGSKKSFETVQRSGYKGKTAGSDLRNAIDQFDPAKQPDTRSCILSALASIHSFFYFECPNPTKRNPQTYEEDLLSSLAPLSF
jgi:hypothetical protein